MSDLRALAHLQEQLGPVRWKSLLNPANTGKVREFCDLHLIALPTEMTIGGRTYEILSFLRVGDTSVTGNTMVERAKEMGGHLGKSDREHILAYQDEIPVALQGKVDFVFTDDAWTGPYSISGHIHYIFWNGHNWGKLMCSLDRDWKGNNRVLRRKRPSTV